MRHLQILDFIVDVGTTGSVRGTAERMNITASALTRKIQDFERELGVPVFERLPRGQRTMRGVDRGVHVRLIALRDARKQTPGRRL